MKKIISGIIIVVLAFVGFQILKNIREHRGGEPLQTLETLTGDETRYLAFQIFTGGFESGTLFPSHTPIRSSVENIISTIGTTGSGKAKLGFVPGPIALDQTDEQVTSIIRDSFQIAQEKDIAVGFHLDDSMFWGRLTNLNTPKNIEWLDWSGTPSTGRRLDWSSKPSKVMPQLCVNSPDVKAAVETLANLIGGEIKKGLASLKSKNKENLFLGVIAGWETQLGRDFDTGKPVGYCALTNKGFSAANPPKDEDRELENIMQEFINHWSTSLAQSGVPKEKIYSHIAFITENNYNMIKTHQPSALNGLTYGGFVNYTPVNVAFGSSHNPGFSTYPQPGQLEVLKNELEKNQNPPWASAEGTALDPAQAEKGNVSGNMESYLANLYNRGAVVVNIFGWGVGEKNNPFRRVAEGSDAIAAYQKFLNGQ